jgi:Flp pilus assembly protein TadB
MARVLFGLVLLGTVALLLGLEGMAGARRRRLLRVLGGLDLPGRHRPGPGSVSTRQQAARALQGALRRMGPLGRLGPVGGETARRLLWADVPLSAEQFAALRLLAAMAGGLFAAAVAAMAGGPAVAVPAAILGALGGHAMPDAWLARAVRRRHRAIDAEILYFLDFLALAARGGLTLEQAVDQVALELPGVLSSAFARVRAEQGLGQWNEHALSGLGARLGHRDSSAVVEALARAGRFGSPTAPLLQDMAGSLRAQRALSAREHAGRVGAAIIVPVAVFILPAIVVVLGYPALATVAGALGGR